MAPGAKHNIILIPDAGTYTTSRSMINAPFCVIYLFIFYFGRIEDRVSFREKFLVGKKV